jgi:hypothetical protein
MSLQILRYSVQIQMLNTIPTGGGGGGGSGSRNQKKQLVKIEKVKSLP